MRVIADLAELAREAAALDAVETDLLVQRAADRADAVCAQGERSREHLDRDRIRKERLDIEQAEHVAERERGTVQHVIAGGQRFHHRGDLDLLAAAHRGARTLFDLEAGRCEDVRREDAQEPRAVVAKREMQLEHPIDAECATRLIARRHPPRQLDLLAAQEDRRRIEHQVQREQEGQHRARERDQGRRAAQRADDEEQQRRAENELAARGEPRNHPRWPFGIL